MNSDNQHDHHRTTVEDKLAATQYNTDMNFTVADITYAIWILKSGKSAGPDGLSAEHFKLSNNRLCVLMSLAFKCMSSHGFIPSSFMQSTIIPLIKDKTGDITDTNNYRPIALATMSSKIMERVILPHIFNSE